MTAPTVSEETARRIAEALEEQVAALRQVVALLERVAHPVQTVSFPNAPVLPKDRPRAGGRGR